MMVTKDIENNVYKLYRELRKSGIPRDLAITNLRLGDFDDLSRNDIKQIIKKGKRHGK